MKYALIGCGRIAVNHIKAAVENKLDVVAVCDLDLRQIDVLFEKTGFNGQKVKRYRDYKQMILDNKELCLVSIATESGAHAEIAIFAMEHGVNVIVEKPIAMSINDADLMIETAKKNNVKLAVCHQNRFNKAVQEARKAIDANRLGKISHGSVNVRWNRGIEYYQQANWRGKWASDGGALMNQCIHGIDLLRWMMNDEITEVFGVTRQRLHDYLECEDVGVAVLAFKNGSIASIEGTVNVFPKNLEETLYLFGENGTIKLGGTSCNNIDIWDFKDKKKDDSVAQNLQEATSNVYGNGHILLFKDMINAITNDLEPYVNGISGRKALEVVLAIYKSQLTGLPVKLPLKDFSSTDLSFIFGKGSL